MSHVPPKLAESIFSAVRTPETPVKQQGAKADLNRNKTGLLEKRKFMTQQNWLQNLTKSEKDRWIGGVCGGLGEHTFIPSWTWRLIFTFFLFICGAGLLLYILLWIFVPRKSKTGEAQPSI